MKSLIVSIMITFLLSILYCDKGENNKRENQKTDTTLSKSIEQKAITTSVTKNTNSEMVLIPSGTFNSGPSEIRGLGSDGKDVEKIAKTVRKVDEFHLDKKEVSVAEYRKVMYELPPWEPKWGWKDNNPVVFVTLANAKGYCNKLGKRLPSEWEWEYAAGGPEHYIYPNDSKIDCNDYCISTPPCIKLDTPCPVGSHKPNGFGLYDMEGNVAEWTTGEAKDDYWKIVKGCSFDYDDINQVGVNIRRIVQLSAHFQDLGFRCAK